jgi:hypothetical protein
MTDKIRTSLGHTYLRKDVPSRENWPEAYDDGLKDEILNRLSRAYPKLRDIAITGWKESDEIGTMMVSMRGLFADKMMAAYMPKSRCNGPLEYVHSTINEGEFHPVNKLHITLFYDHMLEPFHPASQVGIFYMGEIDE